MTRLVKTYRTLAILMMALVAGAAGIAPAEANPSINWTVQLTPPTVVNSRVSSSYNLRIDRGYLVKVSLLRSGQVRAEKSVTPSGINVPVTGTITAPCNATPYSAGWQTKVVVRSSGGTVYATYLSPIRQLPCA